MLVLYVCIKWILTVEIIIISIHFLHLCINVSNFWNSLIFLFNSKLIVIYFKINLIICIKKLDGLKTQDKTQITMIVIWVTELFMNQMGALRSNNTSYIHDSQYMELQKQFDSFLTIPKVEVRMEKRKLEENKNEWKKGCVLTSMSKYKVQRKKKRYIN